MLNLPYKDKEKQKAYQRDYRKEERQTLKNLKISGIFKKGDKAKIYNQTGDGKEILEGEAILVRKLMPQEFQEYWVVDFGDGQQVYRWIRAENKIAIDGKKESLGEKTE